MWEYKVEDDLRDTNPKTLAESLNNLDAKGWELVSVTIWHNDGGFEHTRYFFRRRKAEV